MNELNHNLEWIYFADIYALNEKALNKLHELSIESQLAKSTMGEHWPKIEIQTKLGGEAMAQIY